MEPRPEELNNKIGALGNYFSTSWLERTSNNAGSGSHPMILMLLSVIDTFITVCCYGPVRLKPSESADAASPNERLFLASQ